MSLFNNFMKPSESHLVVGRRNYEKRFKEILISLKEGDLKENLVIISGSPGIGKTSLLNVFEEIVLNEMFVFIKTPIGMGSKSGQNFFSDMYKALDPYLEEIKKGFFKKSKEVEIRSFKPSSKVGDLTSSFRTNLNERPPKSPIVISIDPIDRLLDSGQKYIVDGLEGLIKSLHMNYPIIFVITCQEYNLGELPSLIKLGNHFILDRLDFKDSKLMLSKIARGKLRSSSYLREEIVKQSDRTPFNLTFCADVVNWIEDKIKRDGLNESEENIRDMATPFIRNFALRTFINEVFHITEDENELIQQMLNQPRNAIQVENLDSAKISKTVIDSLVTKGLIVKQNDYYQFVSYALFSSLGSGLSAVDLKAEVGLLLQILEGDLVMGFSINPKVLERLEQASYQSEGLDDQSIPNRTKSLYQNAFDNLKFFEAYRLALLTGNFLRMAKDIEGSGIFFEESAQTFYDNGKIPYATALYRKSIEAYQHVRNERKRKDISQRVAMVYLQIAEKYEKQGQIGLARSNYYHATILFDKADDLNSARDAVNKAIKTYSPGEGGKSLFFHNLIKSTESKVD